MAVFHLRQSGDSGFWFVASAQSRPRLIQSGTYATREAAVHAVDMCRFVSPQDAHYQRHEPRPDKHYFDMTDMSGNYLATSDTFSTAQQRDEAIAECREHLATADLVDETILVGKH